VIVLLAENRNQRLSNLALHVDRRRVERADGRTICRDRRGAIERNGLPFRPEHDRAIRDKAGTRSWSWRSRTDLCDARRSVLRLNWRGRSNQRLRASDNKHRPPFDPHRRFFCTFKRELSCPVCIPYRRRVYVHTLGRESHGDLLVLPFFFLSFFRPPLPRTWNPLEHESLGPSLVLDGVSVGYFVDVPCRAVRTPSRPPSITVDHRRFTMPHDSRSSTMLPIVTDVARCTTSHCRQSPLWRPVRKRTDESSSCVHSRQYYLFLFESLFKLNIMVHNIINTMIEYKLRKRKM